MPGGRPTKYKKEFCEQVIECGEQGMGLCEMAAEIGVAYQTFLNWQDEKPEFLEAVKTALRCSQAWWERKGREATFDAQGFSATSYIFQMKNRFKEDWRDKQEVDNNHKVSDLGDFIKAIADGSGRIGKP